MIDYKFQTEPYKHQLDGFLNSRDAEFYGIFWEQGTGKSKLVIDTGGYNYCTGNIQGMLAVAPKGVHRNWFKREIPTHLPKYIPVFMQCWPKVDNRLWKPGHFNVLCMNIDALITDKGFDCAAQFLSQFPALYTIDESSRIKTPSAQRTKASIKLTKYSKMRRIASGTPANKPFDLYSQLQFLSPEICGNSYTAFKNRYAVWCDESDAKFMAIKKKIPQHKQKWFQMVKTDSNGKPVYQNIDELTAILNKYGSRVLKEECLDLPPKVFQEVFVDLSPEQRKFYKSVLNKMESEFDGKTVSIPIILTRYMRLQQIVGGFIQYDDDKEPYLIGDTWKDIPRCQNLVDSFEDFDGKAIIWAKFRPELNMLQKALCETYGEESAVTYHGGTNDKDREYALDNFQNPDSPVRFFIGQQRAGGIGLTLTEAEEVHYYSNDFSYEYRKQSEDRAHRSGLTHKVLYKDYVAEGTIDEVVIKALVHHQDVADQITGDNIRYMEEIWRGLSQ